MDTVFTIGHSTHTIERFVELLRMHGVDAVADVRSHPRSRFNPHFDKAELSTSLRDNGIKYVFLGKELGARSADLSCYVDGKAKYDLIARTAEFQDGLQRVLTGARKMRLALMCAEKDPLQCHRTILVARHLVAHGARIEHVLADGTIETQDDAISRLIGILRVAPADMLRSQGEVIEDAYQIQGASIAYQERQAHDDKETARLKQAGGMR